MMGRGQGYGEDDTTLARDCVIECGYQTGNKKETTIFQLMYRRHSLRVVQRHAAMAIYRHHSVHRLVAKRMTFRGDEKLKTTCHVISDYRDSAIVNSCQEHLTEAPSFCYFNRVDQVMHIR